ncbi:MULTISPECIES: hypothetical protein [unclassified Cryobacterium]|uniref:hypothetical protein n=1 Tax=unclassified Cryobacterium TaxID=2649013 RepID=UPI000CE3D4C4|nr:MULTISPECIES: hypothetical protein [unclassified Cryobacterium]
MVRARHVPLHRLVLITLTVGLAAFALSPPVVAGGSEKDAAPSSPAAPLLAEYTYNAAVETFTADRAQAVRRIDSARADIAAAELAWQSSAAIIGESAARTELRRKVDSGLSRVDQAVRELDRANTMSDFSQASAEHFISRPDLATQTVVLAGIRFDRATDLADLQLSLTAWERVVAEAVAAWHVEQARLAAEEAAQVEARAEASRMAAEQAARSAAAQGPGVGRSADAATSVSFSKLVWTAGWQSEIDACQGAVDIGAHYGVPVIAEHWSCGGSRFPREGSTITLTGAAGGIYRVGSVAAVLNVAADTADDVPRGFDLLYQTCINGSSATMSFTELTRIG